MSSTEVRADRYAETVQRPHVQEDPRISLYGLAHDEHAPQMIDVIEKMHIPDASDVFTKPGYTSPPALSNSLATAALYIAVASIFIPFLIPITLVLAVLALLKAQSQQKIGMRQAVAALIITAIEVAMYLFVVSFFYWLPEIGI